MYVCVCVILVSILKTKQENLFAYFNISILLLFVCATKYLHI